MAHSPQVVSRIAWLRRHPYGGALLISTSFVAVALLTADFVPVAVPRAIFWPVTLLMRPLGTGPSIGTPENPAYEGTPLHLAAAILGVSLSWLLYTVLLFLWFRGVKQRGEPTPQMPAS